MNVFSVGGVFGDYYNVYIIHMFVRLDTAVVHDADIVVAFTACAASLVLLVATTDEKFYESAGLYKRSVFALSRHFITQVPMGRTTTV